MAPITQSKKADVKDDIWSDLLSSLQTRSTSRGNKTVVMLGTPKSGKSTLISKMMSATRETEHIHSNPGVEFNYLTVRDEETERIGQIGVHSTSYKQFLGHALTKERLDSTLVVITLSIDKPWNLDDELFYWTSLLQQHIQCLEVGEGEMGKLRQKVVDLFSSYKLPEKKKKKKKKEEEEEEEEMKEEEKKNKEEEDEILLPMPEGALVSNLGVPVIVVLSKVDAMSELQKENDFSEEHFEFIQWHLRRACLAWGAGLLYCSPRENSNTKLLLDYVCHVFYGLKFATEPQVVDKDAIFVPIGWDSPSKISLLSDGFVQFSEERPFAEQIAPLPDIRQKRALKGEDDQLFLTRMQAVLAEKQKTGSSPSTTHKVLEGEAKGSTKTPPPADGVLANFFNSLLTKKPGSASSTPAHSPSPPPTQNTLVPPKKALAPQLSAPQQREEHEKQTLGPTRSSPNPNPEPEQAAKSAALREKSPAKTQSKLPASTARDKSPAKIGVKKAGIPTSTGVKKPAAKRGLPQLRK